MADPYRVDPHTGARARPWVPGVAWADVRGNLWIGPGQGWHVVDLHSSSWLDNGRVLTFAPPDHWYELVLVERASLARLAAAGAKVEPPEERIDPDAWPNIHRWASTLPLVCLTLNTTLDAMQGGDLAEQLRQAGVRAYSIATHTDSGHWTAGIECRGGDKPRVEFGTFEAGHDVELLTSARHAEATLSRLTDGVVTFSLVEAVLTLEGAIEEQDSGLPPGVLLDRQRLELALERLHERVDRTRAGVELAVARLSEADGSTPLELPAIGRVHATRRQAQKLLQRVDNAADVEAQQSRRFARGYRVDGVAREVLELPEALVWRLDRVDPWEPLTGLLDGDDLEQRERDARIRSLALKVGFAVAIALLLWWVARG